MKSQEKWIEDHKQKLKDEAEAGVENTLEYLLTDHFDEVIDRLNLENRAKQYRKAGVYKMGFKKSENLSICIYLSKNS